MLTRLASRNPYSHQGHVGRTILWNAGAILLAAAGAHAQCTPNWTQMYDWSGPTIANMAMVFDAAWGRVLLIGDTGGSSPAFQTWSSDGTAWTRLNVGGPAGSAGGSMAYDSRRGVVVVFGINGGETWEWNGSGWTQRATSGPPPSSWGQVPMAYDSDRGVTVVYDGTYETTPDTWEWDGTTWTDRGPCALAERGNSAMAYDPVRHRTVLYGGDRGGWGSLGDTWEWDGSSWTFKAFGGPAWGSGYMFFDPVSQHILMLQDSSNDLWSWDGMQWTRLSAPSMLPPRSAAAAYDPVRSRLMTLGRGGMWFWDHAAWSLDSTGPYPQESPIAYDSVHNRVLLVSNSPPGVLWAWNGASWSIAAYGGPMADIAVFDSARGVLVVPVFGTVSETWEWDGVAWSRHGGTHPPPRGETALAFDTDRGKTVLFGGYDSSGAGHWYGDTWEYDASGWRQAATTGPGTRADFGLAYDRNRHVTVLQGGLTYFSTFASDTWEWNGSTWTRSSDGPQRAQHHMAYDEAAGRLLLFGGVVSNTFFNQTWARQGTTWAQLATAAAPTSRLNFGFAFDAARRQAILFGGVRGSDRADLWVLGCPSDCYANCDGSTAPPILNVNDFFCFQSRFAAGDPYANCDGSTVSPTLNVADFICFMTRFVAGCP